MSAPRRRANLFRAQKGLCFWCGCRCSMTRSESKRMFTVDHLIHRMDPIRRTPGWQKQQRTVGACRGCNYRRGVEDQARFARLAAAGALPSPLQEAATT